MKTIKQELCALRTNKTIKWKLKDFQNTWANILFTIEHREHNKCLNWEILQFYAQNELISNVMPATGLKILLDMFNNVFDVYQCNIFICNNFQLLHSRLLVPSSLNIQKHFLLCISKKKSKSNNYIWKGIKMLLQISKMNYYFFLTSKNIILNINKYITKTMHSWYLKPISTKLNVNSWYL